MKRYLIYIRDLFLNIFYSSQCDLFYIVENTNWVTDQEWKNISLELNNKNLIRTRVSSTHLGLRNKIIHFGSVNTFISTRGLKKVHHSNKIILTWFHLVTGDPRLRFISDLNEKVDIVHTSCEITRNKLIKEGLLKSRVVIIPLGIDLNLFKPGEGPKIQLLRQSLGIPNEAIIIGSFQKDGNGWAKGNIPKLVKGPDIFCDVIERLGKKYPIYVLLTGPARGYVVNRLRNADVKYSHVYLKDFNEIVSYYQILDLYLICSREEGGPKALLEAMACGIPLVSTIVGMAPEIIINGQNGYLCPVEDTDLLYEKVCHLVDNLNIRKGFSSEGLAVIKKYEYNSIAKIYWDRIYLKLLIKNK